MNNISTAVQDNAFNSDNDSFEIDRDVDAIISGKYDQVGGIGHNSGGALKRLSDELQGKDLVSLKLLASVKTQISDVMTLSAWTYGNAQKLSHESSTVSAAVEEIATTVRSIAEASNSARGQTSEVKELVQDSVDKVMSAERSMTEISESFDSLNSRLQSLDGAIETIGGFAKDIEAISNQTKLLALNATIEAARAGEAGKGFAVVASEVKSLSEQTSKTTEMISKQLGELDNVMTAMIESMTNGGARVKEGAESFGQVVRDIDQIRSYVDTADAEMTSVSDALSVQSDTIDSAAKNVVEISGLAKNNTDDAVNSINLMLEAQKKLETQLESYSTAVLPNQAIWRLRPDHMAWKQALAECLVSLKDANSLDRNMISLPCGTWIKNVDDESIKSSSEFRALTSLEGKMSATAEGIVKDMQQGNVGEAIGAFFGMEEQSKEALALIETLEARVR